MLMKKAKLFFSALFLMLGVALSAQNVNVKGVVRDAAGNPIPGAGVLVQGTSTGVAAGLDGEYSITAPANGTLVFKAVGYKDSVIPVQGQSQINVVLAEDAEALEGTIIVGYGSARKIGNVVGSVETVSSSDISEKPTANIADALQGKVAGLQVFNTSGEPQSSVSLRLRGESSINLSSAPLYILDGIPVSSGVFSSINPNDIENISVLKDASSTAIYGSRAANGVIFVTTKKGKLGEKPTVSARAQYGISMLTMYNLDMMNASELLAYEEKVNPANLTDPAFQAKKAFVLGNGIDFNWTNYLFDRSAPLYQADLSLRGATERTNYYLSFGFYSEEGTSKINSSTNRFNVRSNVNTRITDWLEVGSNLGLAFSKYHTITTGWYSQSPMLCAVTELPYEVPFQIVVNPDGTVSYGDVHLRYPWDNQIDLHEYYKNNTNDRQEVNVTGQAYLQLAPVKGLKIRSAEAVDAFDYTNESINKPSYTPYAYRGRNAQAFQRYYQLSTTNTIEYTTNFGRHNVTALLGQEAILRHYKYFNATGTGLTDDRLTAFGTTTAISSWDGYNEESTFNSYFLNLNYNFDERYFLDASVRRDGSSLFGANHKYATFYAIGAMWKVKHEAFMQNVGWVNDLNVNLTYGTTGNSGMSSWYASLGLVGAGSKYNNISGWGLSQVPNADLTWETVATTNFAISGRLFDRVGFDFQLYNKYSSNLLMELPFSATTGHSSGWGNVAELSNRGIDLSLDVDIIRTKNFLWNVSANVNYNRNRIEKLYQGLDELTFIDEGLKYQVGHDLMEVFVAKKAGIDPEDGAPMWYIPGKDGETTKEWSDDLYQFWDGKSANSPWSGGFSTNFSWGNWGLNADFSWIGDRYIWLNERYYTRNTYNLLGQSNFERCMMNIWTKPGDVTDIPKYGTPFRFDTSVYSNAAFLRLKNITLSYSLPKKVLEKNKVVSGFRVYVTGRNLLTATKFEGYDPEVGYSNGTAGLYPNSRQIVGGIEIQF